MSAYIRGRSNICIVSDQTGFPAWQPGIDLSITKTVDAFALTLTCDRLHAGIPGSITWNGHEFLTPQPADNGRNAGFSDGLIFAGTSIDWNLYTPTWAGCQDDSSNKTSTCESNRLLSGKNAAGDGFSILVQSVNWLKNGQDDGTFGGHGGGRNTRDLSPMLSWVDVLIALGGNGNIIQMTRSILIPTDALIQSAPTITLIPNYFYAPNPSGTPDFSVMEFVDLATGATRAATSLATSTTEAVMCSNAAGTFAIAVVSGPGLTTTYEAFAVASATGFTSGSARHIGLATTPGVWYEPTALCVGTRAKVITAVVAAAAGLPACTFTAGKTSLP